MMRLPTILACLCLCLLLAAPTRALDEAGGSAVAFLREATRISRDNREGRILTALRHLEDPALEPLFARLAADKQARLAVHGLLGLAEVSADHHFDLARLAQVERPEAQALIISSGLDAGLITANDAKVLLSWAGLDPSVKLLVAVRRFREAGFDARPLLHESLQADKLGRRALAALMLHELGDAAGTSALAEINASTDPQRDPARRMLLQTALREDFRHAGAWAYSVATDATTDELTQLLALRAAIRFGERRGVELWQQRFAAAVDPSDQVRLALTALHVAAWSPTELFGPLRTSADPLLRQIGDTGGTVAAAGTTGGAVAEQVVALLLLHHPYTNAWALEYARDLATPEDAQLILLGLIKAFEQGPADTRSRRVDETVAAAQLLHERFPAIATAILRPMLADAPDGGGVSDLTRQAILLGLLQSKSDVTDVVANLPRPRDTELAAATLVLKATSRAPLTPAELADLALLVRGGSELREELRAQAAWAYLTRTRQTRDALTEIVR